MPLAQIELRGTAEAVLGKGSFRLARGGPYTAEAIVQEVAASSPILSRELLTAAGAPRDAVKLLVDDRVPRWHEIINGGHVRVVSTLPCDG
jgi:hypothetical protein